MKKKILLTLAIVSLFVCLFAISASAAELIDGIYYTFGGTAENPTATVSADNVNCALEIVNIPETVEHNGTVYTVTALAENAFSGSNPKWAGNKTIKEVTVPKTVSSMGAHCFRSCKTLEKVTVLSSSGTYGLNNAEFYSCTSLKEVDFSKATSITSLGGYTFHLCSSLETVKLGEGLTTINDSFKGCSKLKNITFPTTLKSITGKQAFSGGAYTSIVLYEGLEKLGNNIFQASKLESIVIPKSVTSIGEHCFNSTKSLKYAVIANPDVSGYNSKTFYDSAVTLIFYAGDEAQANALKTKFERRSFTNVISYEEYLKNPSIDSYTSTIVYGTKNCTVCGDVINNDVKFQFTDYLSSMQDATVCSCGKTNVVESYAPIMEFVGYSAKIDGDRICVGYTINSESLKVFTEKTGKVLNFGVTAAIVADGTTQYQTVNSDLTAANDKTVVAQIGSEYAGFDFILAGFTSAHYEKSLVMCAFVYDGSKISYIDNGGCNEFATPFTFNTVAK